MSATSRIVLGVLLIAAGIAGYALRHSVTGTPPEANWWRPVWSWVSYGLVAGGAYVAATGIVGRRSRD